MMKRAEFWSGKRFEIRRWYLFGIIMVQVFLAWLMTSDEMFRSAGICVGGIALVSVVTKRPIWATSKRRWFGYTVPVVFILVFGFFGIANLIGLNSLGFPPSPSDFAWIAPVVAGLASIADWKATLAVPPVHCPECEATIRVSKMG